MTEGPRSTVVIVPASSTHAPIRIDPGEHEYIDGWSMKSVGEYLKRQKETQ